MSHRPLNRKATTPDHTDLDTLDLDALLARRFNTPEEQLTPSSGFVVSVMDTIHQRASEPPPLAFPWRRAVPGLIAVLSAFLTFFLYAWDQRDASQTLAQPHAHHLALALPILSTAGLALCWSACAICLSIAIAAAAFRFTNHDSW